MDTFRESPSGPKGVNNENEKPERSQLASKPPLDQKANNKTMLERFRIKPLHYYKPLHLDKDEKKKPESSSATCKPRANRDIMREKFQNYVEPASASSLPPLKYVPRPFFFYGSLTDPLRLQEVLQLPAPPVLTPARVQSYKIMLWGQYPALVDGPFGNLVDGMAYVIETAEEQKKLEHYETDFYRIKGIRVMIEGGSVHGKTFMWASDPAELVEGTWNLEEWKKGMENEMASHFQPVEY